MRNLIQYAGRVISDAPGAAHRLLDGDCLLEMALASDSLAADTLEFDVRSTDLSLSGYTAGQPLTYAYKGELVGTYYIQSVERTGIDTYHFTALSAVGLLMSKTHYGGMYAGQTAERVIKDICAGTGVSVEIKTIFRPYKIYGWLPVATARDNLSQVLFAIGASLKTDANGVLRVTSLYTGPSWVRGPEQCFVGGSVEYGTPVARVIVTEHRWEPGSERTVLFEGAAAAGDIIRFGDPCHALQATGLTILESNCNYAKVAQGTGSIAGIKYVHNMRDIVRSVSGGEGRDITAKDAYLVSAMNSIGVAERLAEYYAHTERVVQDVVWAGEHAGDIVRTAHPYGGETDILLSSADLALSGVLRAKEDGAVGYTPPTPESQVYYDHAVVLTGSGTWTAPEEAELARIVLIGGGQGGPGGYPGGQGRQGGSSTKPEGSGGKIYRKHYGSGGEGGKGADRGGEGGNVYETDLDLVPGQTYTYKCGVGGTGGGSNSQGSRGTHTTFGPYSSASGAPRAGGYTEVVSGKIYARPNTVPGVAGGKGTGSVDPSNWDASIETGNAVYGPDGNRWTPGREGEGQGYASGGFGGGAAVGRNGGTGGKAPGPSTGDGGTGATPVAPEDAAVIGEGGSAGHGGGGGGGNGGSAAPISTIKQGAPGAGGSGGRGGRGGPGGIIIYYSVRQKLKSGRFLARGSTPFFSRKRRIFAV